MSGYRFCVNVVTAGFLAAAGSAGWLGFVATATADPGGGSSSSHDSGGSHSSAGGSHSSGSSQRSSGSGASGSAGSRSGHESKTSGSAGTSSAQHGGSTPGGNTGTKSSGSADAPGHAAATKPKASSGPHSADSPAAAAKQAGAGGGVPTKEKRALTDPKPGTSARVSGEPGVSSVAPAQPDHVAAPGPEHKPGGRPVHTPPGNTTKPDEHRSVDSNTAHPKHIEGHGEGNAAGAGAAGEHHGDTANGEHAGIKGEQHPSPSTSGGQESHDSGVSLSPEQNAATSNPSGEKATADAHVDKGIAVAIAKPSPAASVRDFQDMLALSDYTDGQSDYLNGALRDGALNASQQARVDAIKRALEKLPRYEGPVARRTFLPLEVLAKYQAGRDVVEDAFTSTSKNPDVPFLGNTYFEIISKNGRLIGSPSVFQEEAEVLFPPSTAFTVLSRMLNTTTDETVIRMVEK